VLHVLKLFTRHLVVFLLVGAHLVGLLLHHAQALVRRVVVAPHADAERGVA